MIPPNKLKCDGFLLSHEPRASSENGKTEPSGIFEDHLFHLNFKHLKLTKGEKSGDIFSQFQTDVMKGLQGKIKQVNNLFLTIILLLSILMKFFSKKKGDKAL